MLQTVEDAPRPRARPRAAAIGGGLVLALIVLAILFQWNWLRGPLALVMSQHLRRPVTISGDLDVHPWSSSPWARIEGLTIGNPGGMAGAPMARLPSLSVQWRWLPLLRGQSVLTLVRADRPRVRLFSDAAGRGNWDLPRGRPPRIDHLIINDGVVTFEDAMRRVNFAGRISSDEGRSVAGGPDVSTLEGALIVASAPWAGREPLAVAPRVVVRIKLLPLMGGTLILPLVEADQPRLRLVRDAAGRTNWAFGDDKGKAGAPPKLPPINHLIISGGQLRYDDAQKRLSFAGTLSTSETVTSVGRGTFLLQGRGAMNAAPFFARVSGGPLVNIDPGRPYPFDVRIEAGATRVAATGAIAHPFDLGAVSGRLRLSGPNLADLYPLSGVALPSTPPYALSAGFARLGSRYTFNAIAGRLGDSDLGGAMTVDDRGGRPFVTADLTSRRLKLVDLAAVIGGVPRHAAGHTLSPAQKITVARLNAEHRILPDARLDVASLRTTDARVVYHAQSVEAGRMPVRAVSFDLTLDHGLLSVDPLTMTLPQGDLAGVIRLDARGAVPSEAIDMRLSNARLENLVAGGGANPPLNGALYGRAKLAGVGDSVRTAAASASGVMTVVIPQGHIRQAFAELMGIDVTKGLFLLLSKNQDATPIRCAVADFRADGGVMTARRIVLDTGVVLVLGKGQIDLRDETLHLQLSGKPKKFRLVRIGAPITLGGSLASPKFGLDAGKAAGQLAVSGLLGAVVAPLAAILPFVNAGLAKNADCAALESEAGREGAAPAKR